MNTNDQKNQGNQKNVDKMNSRASALEKMDRKIDEKKYKEFVENMELLGLVLTRNVKREEY